MRPLAKRAAAAAALIALTACSSPTGGQAVAGSVDTPSASSETTPREVDPPEQAPIPTERAALPKRPKPLPNPSRCRFRAEGEPAKEVTVPKSRASARGTVRVTMRTTAGQIGLTLHRALAPCTVHSLLSLIRQRFYDATECHRLGTGAALQMLQCGDPEGDGTGGPGYTVPDEFFPQLKYGRGLVAMANAGQPNSGGSQFFLVYGDADLPPAYTVFGTIDDAGLTVLDRVARAGVDPEAAANGPGDGTGKPNIPVRISSVTTR